MATTLPIHSATEMVASESRTVHVIHSTLRIMLGVVAIVAGIDKFTNLLTDWEQYLNPLALRIIPLSPAGFMHVVGIVEIIAGVIVIAKPRFGGFLVMAWLLAIALQLLFWGRFLDVAVRDVVMALGAA